ncbi:uncharacterized protein LAESUDRAFT_742284 [Laetiporus sulphureus 93-53]|uniref:Uncharacterized protein n=1 Tax=Laetiporus sulphureus 93-53 TaxID=1314785 RepID=A0A165F7M8_9APHY|nr:uncharacterized protein LAESUDRAFT_742284 [Laetiporus sulphureus 93-53]KZT08550.1 hypothetical protein LAESUDRAFT_742284 [Laetiporus sulphureus 93-53]
MPTTRRQAKAAQSGQDKEAQTPVKPVSRRRKSHPMKRARRKNTATSADEEHANGDAPESKEQPATKKPKVEENDGDTIGEASQGRAEKADAEPAEKAEMKSEKMEVEEQVASESTGTTKVEDATRKDHPVEHAYQTGTIERGHIYFFYRPKVEMEEVHSIDDVQRFHLLLIPRPPEFSVSSPPQSAETLDETGENQEMTVIQPGADAVPAPEPLDQKKKFFRLIVVGKKSLPDPEEDHGRGRVFWGTIVTVSDDLQKLEEGLGPREYETKTRGIRHQGSARLVARGAYAIVNAEARVPSDRETHLGYHLSHPTHEQFNEVQEELGVHTASSFVLQVKNPLAPPTGIGRIGLPKNRAVDFPERIMKEVFGVGGERGREDFGLRFASVERVEMLDHEGVELLFIAARSGDEGLEKSLGEGRGEALHELEERESKETIQQIMKELALDSEKIPVNPLEGDWA